MLPKETATRLQSPTTIWLVSPEVQVLDWELPVASVTCSRYPSLNAAGLWAQFAPEHEVKPTNQRNICLQW